MVDRLNSGMSSALPKKQLYKRSGQKEFRKQLRHSFAKSRSGDLMSLDETFHVPLADPGEEFDAVQVEGGLYEGLTDYASSAPRIVVRFVIFFMLTRPLHVRSLNALFEGIMEVHYMDLHYMDQRIDVPIVGLQWTLVENEGFHPYKRYEFKVAGEIPASSPPSLVTAKGRIVYRLWTSFDGISGPCPLSQTVHMATVENLYVMYDSPRQGLEWGCDTEVEMVGTSIEVAKGLVAFVRYPDQWFNGIRSLIIKADKFRSLFPFGAIVSKLQ
jgi:hypothetical protein